MEDYRREAEEHEQKAAALLATLEVPAHVEWEGHTFTDRTLKADWVRSLEHQEGSEWYSVTGEDGWGAGIPKEAFELLKVGDPFVLETKGFNTIGGWVVNGQWFGHLSDQEIQRRNDESLAKMKAEHLAYVEEHREEWTRREEALPDWAKAVMAKNRKSADFETDYMGWGYTLIAIELAVLYAEMGDAVKDAETFRGFQDSDKIREFHAANGTSGNQADWGFGLARAHLRGEV